MDETKSYIKKCATNPLTIATDPQKPLNVSGESIFLQDIDFDNSDFTGWTGDPELLFQSPWSESIFNDSISNPKSIILAFNRTQKALQIGLGENNGGDFSNVKIYLLGSGGAQRSIFDKSLNNEKLTSLNAEFRNEVFNSIKIEFFTSDKVDLSNIIIFKASYDTTQIEGVNPNGDLKTVNTNILGNLLVSLDEQKDAFGRLKVAEPFTVFDSSLTTELSDILFWSERLGGAVSSSYDRLTSSKNLNVTTNGDYVVRQTKQRFKYQPAKSHEFFITGLLSTETNVRKRVGLLDYDNIDLPLTSNTPQNGVFFENNGGVLSWNIANNGVITESATQDNWNIDKADGTGRSGFDFNPDACNIFTGQMEWLGVGVVVVGFAIGAGSVVYTHAFQHASIGGFTNVYMRTANLPVSYEVTSLGGVGSLKAICSSVISGGGFNPLGQTNAAQNEDSIVISNSTELLIGIRQKANSFEYTIDPSQLSILSTNNGNTLWTLCINPIYSGSVTWSDIPNSEVQKAENNNNTVSDFGIVLVQGSFSNNTDSLNNDVETSVKIGKTLLGERDELWLCVTALGNEEYYGTINFKELI